MDLVRRAKTAAALSLTAGRGARGYVRSGPRLWYLLTPPPHLANVGDHAQAVAINAWIRNELGAVPIELDKDDYRRLRAPLRKLVKDEDLILIHSGGNLGDRGIWSETLRRQIISDFPQNRILSLPQTIFFSDTEVGRAEAQTSSSIYRAHGRLVVLARDRVSLEIGRSLFPNSCDEATPDFVLSMPRREDPSSRSGVLLCLRNDDESALGPDQRQALRDLITIGPVTAFDTTLDHPIARSDRSRILDETLELFARQAVVVTDRFHGVIFSYLTRTPCVVLGSADHKLESSVQWFDGCDVVHHADTVEEAIELVNALVRDGVAADSCDDLDARLEAMFADLATRVDRWEFGARQ